MKQDYSIFEKVPIQELINNDTMYSDTETEKSDKEDEQFISHEEFTNNYTFLDNFKYKKKEKYYVSKKSKVVQKLPLPVEPEMYNSD